MHRSKQSTPDDGRKFRVFLTMVSHKARLCRSGMLSKEGGQEAKGEHVVVYIGLNGQGVRKIVLSQYASGPTPETFNIDNIYDDALKFINKSPTTQESFAIWQSWLPIYQPKLLSSDRGQQSSRT
eukprot:scaffold353337_cov39-Prasinocladus_malaysianus.AAC.1